MRWTLVLALGLSFARPARALEPGASPDPVPVAAPAPAAAPRPFRALAGKIAIVEQKNVDAVNADAAVLIGQMKDLGKTLAKRFDATVSTFKLGASGTQLVALPKGLQAQVDVLSRDSDKVQLRVRLVDAQGQPVGNVVQAWLTSGGVTRSIPVAASGEVTVDALEVSDQDCVQIYTGDGDVFVLWLDGS